MVSQTSQDSVIQNSFSFNICKTVNQHWFYSTGEEKYMHICTTNISFQFSFQFYKVVNTNYYIPSNTSQNCYLRSDSKWQLHTYIKSILLYYYIKGKLSSPNIEVVVTINRQPAYKEGMRSLTGILPTYPNSKVQNRFRLVHVYRF